MSEPKETFEQWVGRKKSLQNLTKKEQRRRYADYVLSFAVTGPKRAKMKQNFKAGISYGKSGNKRLTLGSLSKCTIDYAKALVNPWDLETPPCIPDLIVLPSYKFAVRARGTFIIGTAGVGFVTLNPYAVGVDPLPASPIRSGHYTDATYALPHMDIAAAGSFSYVTDTAYNSLDVSPNGIQFRVVGAGLKARYMGSEVFRSGRIVEVRQPNNQAIPNGYNAVNLLAWKESNSSPVNRDYHFVLFRPSNQFDINYRAINIGGESLLLYVEGGTPGQPFEFDCMVWYEVTGTPLPMITQSHSDPLGIAAVHASLPLQQPAGTPKQAESNLFTDILGYAKTAYSFISPMVDMVGGLENVIPTIAAML